MKGFEHGDHRASVMTMSLESARESGIVPYSHFLSFAWDTRLGYVFCPVCSLEHWSLVDRDVNEIAKETDEELEERLMVVFRAGASPSCVSVRAERAVRDVMES